ncbi:MAG: type II secretion system F family protein [Candidatus Spechtbacterales bacterium]
MPLFEYKATTKEGEIQSGKVDAVNREAASQILQSHNLIITSLEAIDERPIFEKRIKIFERVTKKELSIFSRQLATLFKASVPLVVSVRTLATQTKNPKFKEALLSISSNIDGGVSFSQALAEHEDIFSSFYINMVRAGEESGTLDEVLNYLALYTERENSINSKIKGAMTYPIFVIGLLIMVAIAMLVFVIPNLMSVVEETEADLPLITIIVSGTSDFVRTKWYILILGIAAVTAGGWQFLKSELGKNLWHKVQLKIPGVGKLFQSIYMFRFTSSFSMLVKGGVPISSALDITAHVLSNDVYKAIILDIKDKVNKGDGIAATMENYPEISQMVTQMVAVGEQTGQLSEILGEVSKFYEEEVSTAIDALVSLIEPILIVLMGIGVALLIAGVLLPMYGTITELGFVPLWFA